MKVRKEAVRVKVRKEAVESGGSCGGKQRVDAAAMVEGT